MAPRTDYPHPVPAFVFLALVAQAPTAPVFASWRGKPFRLYDGHKDCLHRQAVENAGALRPVINLNTARALGIDVPPQLLATADEVIE